MSATAAATVTMLLPGYLDKGVDIVDRSDLTHIEVSIQRREDIRKQDIFRSIPMPSGKISH